MKRLPLAGAAPAPEPWYRDGIRFECQGSGECCTNHGEYSYVYLSRSDETRLAAHLGLSRRELRRRHTRVLDGWRILKSTDTGCVFLEGRRCAVYPGRPVQCSTWPFWPATLERAVWERDVVPFCAGVGKGRVWTREEIDALAERERSNQEEG